MKRFIKCAKSTKLSFEEWCNSSEITEAETEFSDNLRKRLNDEGISIQEEVDAIPGTIRGTVYYMVDSVDGEDVSDEDISISFDLEEQLRNIYNLGPWDACDFYMEQIAMCI